MKEKLTILVLYFRSDLLLTNSFLLWRQTKPTKRWKRVTPEGRSSSTWRSDREVKDCVDVHEKRGTALNGWIGELRALFHTMWTSGLSLVQFVNSWKIITWYLLDIILCSSSLGWNKIFWGNGRSSLYIYPYTFMLLYVWCLETGVLINFSICMLH